MKYRLRRIRFRLHEYQAQNLSPEKIIQMLEDAVPSSRHKFAVQEKP